MITLKWLSQSSAVWRQNKGSSDSWTHHKEQNGEGSLTVNGKILLITLVDLSPNPFHCPLHETFARTHFSWKRFFISCFFCSTFVQFCLPSRDTVKASSWLSQDNLSGGNCDSYRGSLNTGTFQCALMSCWVHHHHLFNSPAAFLSFHIFTRPLCSALNVWTSFEPFFRTQLIHSPRRRLKWWKIKSH